MKILSPILNIKSNSSNTIAGEIRPRENSSFLHLNKEGVIKNVSDEFCRLTGYNKTYLKGQNISSIIIWNKRSIVSVLIKELSSSSPFEQTKIKILDYNNNPINIELYLTLTSLKEGAPIFAIFRKSGTHQNKYTHLFEKKERLRMLAENSNDVQVLFDTNMDSLFISPSCINLTGFHFKELIHNDLHNLVHIEDLDKFWDSIKEATNNGKSTFIFRLKKKDGSYIYTEGIIKSITEEFDIITHYALYIHDVSHRIKYEQQLLQSKNKAESANKLKDHFLASVSHEFRTPLNAIIGFSRIMEKMTEDPESFEYLKNIEKSGVQLLDMINNLLNFSKIEKDNMQAFISPIKLDSFFKKLSREINDKFPQEDMPDVKLSCNIETYTSEGFMYTDEAILLNIFQNLISNAVKFTKEGYIKYGCKPYGIKNYLFYVEDSGIGIDNEYKRDLFEPLTQQDGSLTRGYNGIGIGLSITKKMIELLRGEIWVISEEGAGSAFYFTLPPKALRL